MITLQLLQNAKIRFFSQPDNFFVEKSFPNPPEPTPDPFPIALKNSS